MFGMYCTYAIKTEMGIFDINREIKLFINVSLTISDVFSIISWWQMKTILV